MTIPPLDLKLDFKKTNTAGPAVSEQSGTSGMFDASNWNVNFSGTQTNASQSGQKALTGLEPIGAALSAGGSSAYIWAALGIVVLAVLYKKMG